MHPSTLRSPRPLALLTAAALALGACATPGGAGGGEGGAAIDPPKVSVDLAPEAIAARAEARTLTLLKAMNRPAHEGEIAFVESIELGEPTALNPQGLRVQRYQLSNGLRVLIWEDHTAPVFAYQTWISVGSRHESLGKTGIAHLFEHLMFKETRNTPAGEFDRLMESKGAQTNAATWLDWTMYREELPAGNLELAVRLEADRLEHMILSAEQLESEREVVKNERRYRVDNDPEGTMFELLYATAFTRHPYSWPTIGWMKDIEAITLEDCLAFYATNYAPNNATLVVVGDVDTEEALALVNAHYGHMKPSTLKPEWMEPEPTQVAERRRLLTMPLSSPKLLLGYHIPGLTDPDHAAVQVLHKILFGGESGRLYRRLVVETELASDASAWVSEFTYPGLYEILITLKEKGDPDRVEGVVAEELDKLTRDPVTAQELEKAKNQLEAHFLRNIQSVGDRAYGLGHYAITGGDPRLLFEVTEHTRAVSAEDVLRVAGRYLTPKNRTVVTALPRP